jgi:hypothetical protein
MAEVPGGSSGLLTVDYKGNQAMPVCRSTPACCPCSPNCGPSKSRRPRNWASGPRSGSGPGTGPRRPPRAGDLGSSMRPWQSDCPRSYLGAALTVGERAAPPSRRSHHANVHDSSRSSRGRVDRRHQRVARTSRPDPAPASGDIFYAKPAPPSVDGSVNVDGVSCGRTLKNDALFQSASWERATAAYCNGLLPPITMLQDVMR